jgi:23S rRNA A2030 N6-methylase RlmJ
VPFATQQEAKEFLIGKIAAQAEVEGNPLLETEKKILAFSEQEPESTLGVTDDMLEEADQEWENGIARLLAASYKRDIPEERERYIEAKKELEKGDHYLSIMVSAALSPLHRWLGS